MSRNSLIEWCEDTWNVVTGCHKVSEGCKHCYADPYTKRLQAMGQEKYKHGFDKVVWHPSVLDQPRHWRKPRIIFVNSLSDSFNVEIPLEFIKKMFEVMNQCPQHTFQVLTKRPEIAAQYASQLTWTPNIWMGTSVEDESVTTRIDELRKIDARIRFLSLEPLLGPLTNLNLDGIHWVIVGGESGPKARPMDKSWVVDIRDQCLRDNVPFFLKQWGGRNKKKAGRILDGREYSEMPEKH